LVTLALGSGVPPVVLPGAQAPRPPASKAARGDPGAGAPGGVLPSGRRRRGYELLALPEPPDAVFCYNDLLALGALRTILSGGLRVPEDIALVGFDDIEDGRYSTPSLTTISPDKNQIAKKAVQLLLNRLEGDRSAPAEIAAGYTLELRESTTGRPA
jgi:DNA-binding LacI/PurR family transcriptional regulator